MIIADTNLLIPLMIRQENAELAKAVLRKDPDWAAPPLWRSEFRNVLWVYIRNQNLSLSDARDYYRQAERLLARNEYDAASEAVLVLAAQSGCSPYDCEFVYVAQKHALPLVTFDKKLLANFPGLAMSAGEFLQRA